MAFCIQEVVTWYQKKIGTYDKQEWEKTVEQRILSGFTHVPKKTAKLKTELIDVDLVRGSSFTKAKPKGGLMAVTRLGLVRLIFLPLYVRWWSSQTSPSLYVLLLIIYTLQIINLFLFLYIPEEIVKRIPGSEVVVPAAMMVLLTVLHSHIVSPRSSASKDLAPFKPKSRRFKRTKKRNGKPRTEDFSIIIDRPVGDKQSETIEHLGGICDSTSKFSKRVRLRKVYVNGKAEMGAVVHGGGGVSGNPVEDDGFESLNSQGSTEDVQGAGTPPKAPEAVFRNNWLEETTRRTSIALQPVSSGETDHKSSESDNSSERNQRLLCRRRGSAQVLQVTLPPPEPPSSCNSTVNDEEDPEEGSHCPLLTEATTSAAEWFGITTNSEECSVGSEMDDHPFASEFHTFQRKNGGQFEKHGFQKNAKDSETQNYSPRPFLSPSCAASDRVSCTMWEKKEVKKADLSVLDISSAIIARVEAMPENMNYFYAGMFVSVMVGLTPSVFRLVYDPNLQSFPVVTSPFDTRGLSEFISACINSAFGSNRWERYITLIALLERTVCSAMFFFLITVAERSFKQRFLYAKFFSHLTSFRRARKSELPHFRLNKVRNIKTWLSVRSYLRKRGPQHSVDVIVSSVFLVSLFLLVYLAIEHLKESEILNSPTSVEALIWSITLGLFLLRFMTLGTKINHKYRNLSVLITEQINLYLQIEQKPNKKDELNVANSVLKLAADLLKELESPYEISGFSAYPYFYTITKVVILSALSGVLSEMLGFKLKLHKIKIK